MEIAAQDSGNATQLATVRLMEIGGVRLEWHIVLSTCVAIATVLSFMMLRKKSKNLPPGPWPLPLIGNMHQIWDFSPNVLMKLAEKYGSIIFVRFGSKPVVIVSTAEEAIEFVKLHDKEWADRPHSTSGQIFTEYKNITWSPYGEHWRHLRRICNTDLFTPKRLMSFLTPRTDEIGQMMTSIHKDITEGKQIKLQVKLAHLSSNNMTRMLLGQRFFGIDEAGQLQAHRFKELVFEMFTSASSFSVGDIFPWLGWISVTTGFVKYLRRVKADIDAYLQEFLEIKKAKGDKATAERTVDFVDVLLEQKSATGDDHLDDSTILNLIQDMLVAGSDTVSNAMEWSIAELLRHPDCMRKLQQEIDTVVGKSSTVSESDIPNLPYLQAVTKEILRLYPPAPLGLPHQSRVPTTVCGYDFPAGTQLFLNIYAIQRDPKHWPNPLQFNPDRFMNCPDIDVTGAHFQLIPFGAGRRQCPGMNMANLLLRIVVARLVQAFDFSLPDGQDPLTLDTEAKFSITLPRKNPLTVIATPRHAARLE